jgi:hypothetical protein
MNNIVCNGMVTASRRYRLKMILTLNITIIESNAKYSVRL